MSLKLKVGDTNPDISATLTGDDGEDLDLSGAEVTFRFRHVDDDTATEAEADITDEAGGEVKYQWQDGDLDKAGHYVAEWKVDYGGGSTIITAPGGSYTSFEVVETLE